MKTFTEIKTILKQQKPYLIKKYGITEIGVFGSYVHNKQNPDSDLDILINLKDPPQIDLFDLVNLNDYLSDLMGIKVDIAIKKNLRRRIGQRILDEVVMV